MTSGAIIPDGTIDTVECGVISGCLLIEARVEGGCAPLSVRYDGARDL